MYKYGNAAPYGFDIVGEVYNERRLVDWSTAFVAFAECDNRAEVTKEGYLSAFCFGAAFRDHLDATGSTKRYTGVCWAPWLWFDIDRDDLDEAHRDTIVLISALLDRFDLDDDALLLFFSGRRGFHVGLPLAVCGAPPPSQLFHRVCRRIAENLAALAKVAVDTGVYDAVRAFRAPNSKHPKTWLHKRRFDLRALQRLPIGRLVEMTQQPEPFELPDPPSSCSAAVADWHAATLAIDGEIEARKAKKAIERTGGSLNRATLDFIGAGAATGDRHRLLFSAAANLAEFDCGFNLAYALLSEAALDSGLPPADVARQIRCGIEHRSNAS